jgi:hypothetical protein
MARRLPLLAAASCLASGCSYIGPDQEHFASAEYWNAADVSARQWTGQSQMAEMISVSGGEHTLLLTSDGYSRGKRSSAHASHWFVFLTLPREVKEGQTYDVSREAGTLHLDAFAGYDPWCIDPDRPAGGSVHIREVRGKAIVADLRVRLTAVSADSNVPVEERRRLEVTREGVFEFRRSTLRTAARD